MPGLLSAQCKNFTKKKCFPSLENYVPSENYNSLSMFAGDTADLYMVFIANNDYRIVVCSHPVLGDVEYRVETENGLLVYSSEENESEKIFDFSTTNTEKLHLVISVPENEKSNSSSMVQTGCVSIIVGSKESVN